MLTPPNPIKKYLNPSRVSCAKYLYFAVLLVTNHFYTNLIAKFNKSLMKLTNPENCFCFISQHAKKRILALTKMLYLVT